MTPIAFEQQYREEWQELAQLLDQLRLGRKKNEPALAGERFAYLYRRACEQLALARARAYPAYLVERLDHLTAEAHQAIYARREFGLRRLAKLFSHDFPRAVRAHAGYVWIATAVFTLPIVILGLLVYHIPDLIFSVVSPEQVAQFEYMYAPDAESIGRTRDAHSDWAMFGVYIQNNIGLAFQCFASGLLAGVLSLFFLGYNGAFFGAVGGYLTERGYTETFYSFVVTHAAFELTGIVLAGAAGLRLGHALLAPGRYSRRQSLVLAARGCIVIIYGVAAMLFIAAIIEAFWSSAQWIAPVVKYAVAAVCWIAVLSYLTLQGRRAG